MKFKKFRKFLCSIKLHQWQVDPGGWMGDDRYCKGCGKIQLFDNYSGGTWEDSCRNIHEQNLLKLLGLLKIDWWRDEN